MRTSEDVERYLKESAVPYQDLGGGMFIVNDLRSGLDNLAIKVQDNVVVFALRLFDVPAVGAPSREALFEKLLRLNSDGLLHSAFALQEESVYLQAALPLQNLDANEIQAVLDDMGLASSQHVPALRDTVAIN
ncbi:MAG: YbjN domain-containing protein [Deltaproteobacteria bacterium]|nr:YbjN domain-containing protein [Deltaproteobacteria bacterium]